MNVNGTEVQVLLHQGLPLQSWEDPSNYDEETLAIIEEEAGKWCVSSVNVGTKTAEEWENQITGVSEDQTVTIVGDMDKIHVPVALYTGSDGSTMIQLLAQPTDYSENVSLNIPSAIDSNNLDSETQTITTTDSDLNEGDVYTLAELSSVLGNYTVPEGDAGAGAASSQPADPGSPLPLLGILAAATVGMGCLGVATRKKV